MDQREETVGGSPIYTVRTDVYEGPLDVLLTLVEKRKLFINDISLARVADDFISFIRENERIPLREGSHFLFVAATLVLIKSKSLLPTLTLTEEEEESIEELELRLAAYKSVKERAMTLREHWGSSILFFGKGEQRQRSVEFRPDDSITVDELQGRLREMVDRFPSEEILPQAEVREVIKLENVISSLIDRITAEMHLSFNEFSGAGKGQKALDRSQRHTIIVSFIAVLELVKQGTLQARQHEEGDDIVIESSNVSTPNYI